MFSLMRSFFKIEICSVFMSVVILISYLWVLYPSIKDVRNHVGTELIKFPKEASDYYPYLCEVINDWWRFSLDEEREKIDIN